MDDLEIFDCEQNSPEWLEARAGILTASTFSDVLAKGRGGEPSKMRQKLIYSLAAEILSGQPTPSWGDNEHTRRGHALESEVRSLYEAFSPEPVTQVGFCRRGRIGCSPDALVGDTGLLEIKTKLPHLQIEALESGALPSEHVAQVQGQLLVTGREWVDFRSYWPGLPELKIRVFRDDAYLANLDGEIKRLLVEVDAVVAKYS